MNQKAMLKGERLSISRAGGVVVIWTNGRTIVVDLAQAEQIAEGLRVVLDNEDIEACTTDTLEPPRHIAPEQPPVAKKTPTLEDL